MYQGYGELCRTVFGKDFWIKRLETTLSSRAIIADVRFMNEVEWIKERGGLIIGVTGPARLVDDKRNGLHPSEIEVMQCLDAADVTFNNDGDCMSMIRQAITIANDIVSVTRDMIPV
jgi:hypothetical protein